jgi:hypothetical protein
MRHSPRADARRPSALALAPRTAPCAWTSGVPDRPPLAPRPYPRLPTEVASGDMQATQRTKPHRDIARLALWAALIAFLLPLLPLYGDGSGPFIFSSGLPLRVLISFLLVWWTNAVVVAVGILYLKRDRVGVAGGLFLAAALTVAIALIQQVLQTAPHFGRWQTDLVLVLEIIEGGLLALAAVRAIGARAADNLEDPPTA